MGVGGGGGFSRDYFYFNLSGLEESLDSGSLPVLCGE